MEKASDRMATKNREEKKETARREDGETTLLPTSAQPGLGHLLEDLLHPVVDDVVMSEWVLERKETWFLKTENINKNNNKKQNNKTKQKQQTKIKKQTKTKNKQNTFYCPGGSFAFSKLLYQIAPVVKWLHINFKHILMIGLLNFIVSFICHDKFSTHLDPCGIHFGNVLYGICIESEQLTLYNRCDEQRFNI